MVSMSTFTETDHPRGQAANAGQFRSKENDAPSETLSERKDVFSDGQAVMFTGDGSTESELGDAVGVQGMVTPLAPSEYDRADTGPMYKFRALDGSIQVDAFEDELAPIPTPASSPVTEWHDLLADVNTMGGDEIRSLDDETLLRLDSYLLRAAARVQAATAERGLRHERTGSTSDVDQLELVDYRNVTEAQVASAYIAGVSQGIAGGVLRTKGDFYDHAMDQHGERDQEVIDRAWRNFRDEDRLAEHNEDGPSGWGWGEYQKWTSTVAAELERARHATA